MKHPKSFRTQADFRAWLEKNHASKEELLIWLFRVHAKHRGIGYREMLDEALCFGWIDGIKKSYDEDSFTHRLTPRKKKSNWSEVNIKRMKELIAEGKVHAAGLAAFEARHKVAVAPYSYQNRAITLDAEAEAKIRKNKKAWEFFQTLAPWYKRNVAFHIANAKKPETREARLQQLIAKCLDKTAGVNPYASKTRSRPRQRK